MVDERKKIELNYDSMDLSLDQSGDQCQYDGGSSVDSEAPSLASVYFFAAMTSMRIVMATDEIHGWHEALREWLIYLRTRQDQKQSQQAKKMGRSNLIYI